MPLEGLRWSRDSGSALYDTPQNGRSRTGWGGIYNGRFPINASGICHFLSFYANLNLSELSTTLTLEKAIRALAHIGVIWKSMPKI